MADCKGFKWMGQDFAHCEGCSQDIRDHEGLDWINRDTPLGSDSILIPFDEARQRIPLFAYYVTPIGHPEGPYRYEVTS